MLSGVLASMIESNNRYRAVLAPKVVPKKQKKCTIL